MCTAIYQQAEGLFGRTLDLEYTYDEQVTITPRGLLGNRYALIGTATVVQEYPLYYDALNECGLAMAGLHFPHSGVYPPERPGAENVPSWALIPTVLGRCATVEEARKWLGHIHLCDRSFSPEYPATPLHWMVADRTRSLVVESTAAGLQIYDNPAGVMTNEPPFPHQLTHLAHFAHLSPMEPAGCWQTPVSRGAGAVGLPGDFSSPSRFVRAAFGLAHTVPSEDQADRIGPFFRLMATVEVPRGCVRLTDGRCVVSHYTSCMDLGQGVYYYHTYDSQRLRAVALRPENAIGGRLVCHPHQKEEDVAWEN